MAGHGDKAVGSDAIVRASEVARDGVAWQDLGSGWCARIARILVVGCRALGGVVDPKARVYVLACGHEEGDHPPTRRQQAVVEEDRQWWKHSVHRSVLRHLSPGPVAQQLGIIRKTARRAGSLLIGTDEGEYYCLAAFDAAKAEGLLSLHAMGVLLNSLPIPRNNREWAKVQADANRMADTLRIKRPEYRWPWLLRTYI